MPKLKTHKGTSKRIWATSTGKLQRRRAGRSHNRSRKSVKQLQGRGITVPMSEDNARVKELIPYR